MKLLSLFRPRLSVQLSMPVRRSASDEGFVRADAVTARPREPDTGSSALQPSLRGIRERIDKFAGAHSILNRSPPFRLE